MRRKVSPEKDIAEALGQFPKLSKHFDSSTNTWLLAGDLDICDSQGEYWNTFNILILIPNTYPYCVPQVIEKSTLIPRDTNRHISEEGICCLDMDHKLLHMASRGIRLVDFIVEKVYPFFANQLYYDENKEKKYAGEEYEHHFAGVRQFYAEDLNIADVHLAVKVIEMVLANSIPGRNDRCICESGQKFKWCHAEAFALLKTLPTDRLKKDLYSFKDLPPSS
ncbi:MAG: SEC-C metal-binding domain-containing protein [Bacteroidota bacterium]